VSCDLNGTSLNVVEAYSLPPTNQWRKRAVLPTARADLAAVTVGDKIYAIGGWHVRNASNHPIALDTVEVYDPLTNIWTTKAPMPTARYWLSAARGSDGRIYVYGGVDTTTNTVSALEAYDPATDTWATLARLSLPSSAQSAVGAAFVGGKFYVIGGADVAFAPHNTVEAYNPATNNWTAQAPMRNPRGYLAAVATGGHLYAIGGYNSNPPYEGPMLKVESTV
jgi:N-acetylneuraminic acid mutarotase